MMWQDKTTKRYTVGFTVRCTVGFTDGFAVGFTVGFTVRFAVGLNVGFTVGCAVGIDCVIEFEIACSTVGFAVDLLSDFMFGTSVDIERTIYCQTYGPVYCRSLDPTIIYYSSPHLLRQ